jgi:hypothetical protein
MTPGITDWLHAIAFVIAHSMLLAFTDPLPAAEVPRVMTQETTMPLHDCKHEEADTAMALRLITHIQVTAEDVEDWTNEQIRAAENWAAAEHIRQKCPQVPVKPYPMPEFLKRYQGEVTA